MIDAEIVVTGMAIWSPYGRGLEAFWRGLLSGRSARGPVARFDASHPAYRTDQACSIEDIGQLDADAEVGADAVLSAVIEDLLVDAQLSVGHPLLAESGVCVGSSQNMLRSLREFVRARRDGVKTRVSSDNTPLSAGDLSATIGERIGLLGPSAIISTACASSTGAVGVASEWISQRHALGVIVGGVNYFTDLTFSGFNTLRLLGRNGCRPFDSGRDGMMLGDGVALAFLEERSSAIARGAQIRARIVGHASLNEAFHATSPDPSGAAGFRVMWQALQCSRELLDQLDYINAHGTGTLANDSAEMQAIRRLVGEGRLARSVLVSSTKGHHGHALGAAGAVEFVATVLALQEGVIPPTLGLVDPDPACEGIDMVLGAPRHRTIRVALSNSFGFGGNFASVALSSEL